ncbi:MAG: 50S ribosomal protein L22 [Candidatus Diapherotrites archaeon]|nr:50S ribosomal protein L22 [Candidatus Diapherotrites archaeon]
MAKRNFTTDIKGDNITRAKGINVAVSTKYSIELSREIRGKPVKKAEAYLNDIIEMKRFLPLRRFNKHVPHRAGSQGAVVKSGRYPLNTAKAFLKMLDNLKANADYKGLNAENLRLIHVCANRGRSRYKTLRTKTRMFRVATKATNIEMIAREM